MKNLIALLCIVLMSGCAIKYAQCRPDASFEVKQDCQFNKQDPMSCVGQIWVTVTCPTENL